MIIVLIFGNKQKDKVRLTGKGIDINLLKAGKDIEFETQNSDTEDNYDWSDEIDPVVLRERRETIFKNRKFNMLDVGADDANEPSANGEGNDKPSETEAKTPFESLREKMVDVSDLKDGGVLKRIITPGGGIPIPLGSRVRIHYNAYFEMNDEPFDSTHLRNKSCEFRLGDGSVVSGLDIAVSTMKKNEKSEFIIEPEYYCGKQGCPPRVPANTPGK